MPALLLISTVPFGAMRVPPPDAWERYAEPLVFNHTVSRLAGTGTTVPDVSLGSTPKWIKFTFPSTFRLVPVAAPMRSSAFPMPRIITRVHWIIESELSCTTVVAVESVVEVWI